jgi:MoxR-like ATPase
MNPCSSDQSGGEEYLGAEPLDPALADRFAVVLEVGDWDALSDDDRRRVANPVGEGTVSNDGGQLKAALAEWQRAFATNLDHCPSQIVDYVCAATTALREGGIRLSPRRTRLITRTLLATTIVKGIAPDALGTKSDDALFRTVLDASLPQRAWGATPDADKVAAAHRLAWDATMLQGRDRWLHHFHLQRPLDRKAQLLLDACPDPDTGTWPSSNCWQTSRRSAPRRSRSQRIPRPLRGHLPIGAEAVNDLGRIAQPMLTGRTARSAGRSVLSEQDTTHPELASYATVLQRSQAPRAAKRAQQLLYYCLVNKLTVAKPRELEQEFHRCVQVFGKGRTA